jgi:membrane-bound acyltransferase YfiQ involved in biofilm formation
MDSSLIQCDVPSFNSRFGDVIVVFYSAITFSIVSLDLEFLDSFYHFLTRLGKNKLITMFFLYLTHVINLIHVTLVGSMTSTSNSKNHTQEKQEKDNND